MHRKFCLTSRDISIFHSMNRMVLLYFDIYHSAGDVTRVSVVPRKVTVKIGDAENRGCRE